MVSEPFCFSFLLWWRCVFAQFRHHYGLWSKTFCQLSFVHLKLFWLANNWPAETRHGSRVAWGLLCTIAELKNWRVQKNGVGQNTVASLGWYPKKALSKSCSGVAQNSWRASPGLPVGLLTSLGTRTKRKILIKTNGFWMVLIGYICFDVCCPLS